MAGSYDFEEQERLAELKAWWEDNRWFVLGGIVAAALAFGGWKAWQAWQARQLSEAAALFRPVADEKADPNLRGRAACFGPDGGHLRDAGQHRDGTADEQRKADQSASRRIAYAVIAHAASGDRRHGFAGILL